MKFRFSTVAKMLTLSVSAVLLSAALVGCGDKPAQTPAAGGGLTGSISVIGSTSVGPLIQGTSEAFKAKNTGVQIDSQEIGSTQGIEAAINKTADIGTSSRDLTPEEKKAGLTETIIAYDGVAVVLHPDNKVKALKSDQVRGIFEGKIKNWKEVGGADKAITVVTREDGSGTRGAFQELMKLEEKQADGTKKSLITSKALVSDSTGSLKTTVSGNEAAVGYISIGAMDDTVHAVKIDGVEPSFETVKSKKYPIWRPFLLLTNGEMKPEVKAYVDFILSDDGQKLIAEEKFVTIK